MELILHILCGLPGSGKSTLVSKLNGYVVSTDSLRKYLWNNEAIIKHDKLVFDIAKQIITYILSLRQDVIFDATNLKRQNRVNFISLAKISNANVYLHWINCPVEIAIKRNTCRDRKVPVYIIKSFHRSFQRPEMNEGLDKIKIYGQDLKICKIVSKGMTFNRSKGLYECCYIPIRNNISSIKI